jgi:Domain of unknown function (DUF4190)/Septum formation
MMHSTRDTPPWPAPEAPAPPPYAPPPPRKTSGFAIASFVFGLIGGVILSVVFGIIALRRIDRRGLAGKGFAIAGLVLSGLWTLLIVVIVVIGLATGADRDPSGRVTDSGSESVFDLRVGDCMNGLEETDLEFSVDVTPCAEPHGAEVVSQFDLPRGDWPGMAFVTREAESRCPSEVESSAAGVPRAGKIEVFYFHPTENSWSQMDDRTVLCVALFAQPRRGSL